MIDPIIVDQNNLIQIVADKIVFHLNEIVQQNGIAHWMLTGGNTAKKLYRQLALDEYRQKIPWKFLQIYWGDERKVSPDHPDSNFGMTQDVLLQHVPILPEQIHRMLGEEKDSKKAALLYENKLPPLIDLLLLAVGEDGHIASLFPDSFALQEPTRNVLSVIGPKSPVERLTITPLVLTKAKHILVFVMGATKAVAVKNIFQYPYNPDSLPAQLVLSGQWFLDTESATLLKNN